MAGKVDICGIDTSKLPVLSSQRMQELFQEIKQGRAGAREEFIGGNLRLVLSVVQRFAHRGENADDLFQVGCIGLIKAIDHFDVTQEVKFSTYAVPMIIGEIRRYLRDNNQIRVSRSLRDTAYKALQAREKLSNQKNTEPTLDEIAAELDMPREDVVTDWTLYRSLYPYLSRFITTERTQYMLWTKWEMKKIRTEDGWRAWRLRTL